MTTQAIGNIEDMNDPNFIKRIMLRKNTDAPLNSCPNLEVINGEVVPQNVQLAELKSSLLVNNILNNQETSEFLNNWVYLILTNIYGEKYDEVLKYYSELIPASTQKDDVDVYPVAQIKKFSEDPEAIQTDFMANYDFLKWSWTELNPGTRLTKQGEETSILSYYNCDSKMLQAMTVINMIQQRVNNIINTTRGGRRDDLKELDKPWLRKTTDQVGITDIYNSDLTRWVNDYPNEPWLHPGRAQCFVPDRGRYGDFIKQQRDHNTMYSSVQCGISGSTNFGVYMTLIALATGRKTSLMDTSENDVRALITGVTTVLVGDGGHNVRETITGVTLTSIALKTMLDDLKAELAALNNGNEVNLIDDADRIPSVPPGPCSQFLLVTAQSVVQYNLPDNCKKEVSEELIFKNMVRAFGYWEKFINTWYGMLDDINPLAIWTDDLNANNTGILQNKDESLRNAKNMMYDLYLRGSYQEVIRDPSLLLTTQVFTALDNNRYNLDPQASFIDAPNTTFTTIVANLPGGDDVIQDTATEMTNMINFCNQKYGAKPNGKPVIDVPYHKIPLAFKGTVNRGPLMARNPKEYKKLAKFYGEDNVVLIEN